MATLRSEVGAPLAAQRSTLARSEGRAHDIRRFGLGEMLRLALPAPAPEAHRYDSFEFAESLDRDAFRYRSANSRNLSIAMLFGISWPSCANRWIATPSDTSLRSLYRP